MNQPTSLMERDKEREGGKESGGGGGFGGRKNWLEICIPNPNSKYENRIHLFPIASYQPHNICDVSLSLSPTHFPQLHKDHPLLSFSSKKNKNHQAGKSLTSCLRCNMAIKVCFCDIWEGDKSSKLLVCITFSPAAHMNSEELPTSHPLSWLDWVLC